MKFTTVFAVAALAIGPVMAATTSTGSVSGTSAAATAKATSASASASYVLPHADQQKGLSRPNHVRTKAKKLLRLY
uniref:Uncharacterized protein n=1 Tax=Bionectria ochroleuca TaxID=29856 RepID=A0A8H7NEC3_BIOOC